MNNNYNRWIESYTVNPEIKKELFYMDEEEIMDAFGNELEFKTAGLRGKIGPGTNRMNHYTVAKATLGFIKYLINKDQNVFAKGIVVAYDNRNFSQEFAALVANLFASENIKVYIFENLRPTPQLSFMITYLGCSGGVNITASHNPKDYNGYKVYDHRGVQLLPEETDKVAAYVNEIKDELSIDIENFEDNDNLIHFLDKSYDDIFIDAALNIRINENIELRDTPIIYTPLHGTGANIIPNAVSRAGFSHFFPVVEQMNPSPIFINAPIPNPEDYAAFELAVKKANELKVDYIIASDPDADRVGVCVRKNYHEFKLLSGNDLGALLLDYILKYRERNEGLPSNALVIDTIVTSDFGKAIANSYGVQTHSVLTGFKYIGDLAKLYKKTNEYTFEFGYEESLGYLASDYIGDKDAVSTTLLIIELINSVVMQGRNLLEELELLYQKHGYYLNKQISIILEEHNSQERIYRIMDYFKQPELTEINGVRIVAIEDYNKQMKYEGENQIAINLPKENVLKIILEDESWIAIRPSGTEPKLKFYLAVKADSSEGAKEGIKDLQTYINDTLEDLFK